MTAEGVVHRDLKPENVLIDAKGQVRLVDFGVAKLSASTLVPSLTGSLQALGTPHYMAPEQLERPTEVDQRADLYAVGVLLFELLTGRLPLGRFAPPSARRDELSDAWDALVLRLLEQEPEDRFQSAAEVLEALEGLDAAPRKAGAPTSRRKTPPRAHPARRLACARQARPVLVAEQDAPRARGARPRAPRSGCPGPGRRSSSTWSPRGARSR